MRALRYLLLLVLLLVAASAFVASSVPRQRRQIDLTLSAEHDDKDDETELALEAIAGLWQSADSRTKVDGSASLVHRTMGGTQSGMGGSTKYQARLHLHHDYKPHAYPS